MIGFRNLWCMSDGLYGSYDKGNDLTKVVNRDPAYLTSDEQTYGDIFFEKDTDMVIVDASYGAGLDGFDVLVAAKQYVSDPDNFKKLGHWWRTRHFRQADGKKQSGRSLKFKFVVGDKIARWDGKYLSEGHVFDEGLILHVWDGSVLSDGKELQSRMDLGLLPEQVTYNEEAIELDIGEFTLYAWGERVMIPKDPVGEDK